MWLHQVHLKNVRCCKISFNLDRILRIRIQWINQFLNNLVLIFRLATALLNLLRRLWLRLLLFHELLQAISTNWHASIYQASFNHILCRCLLFKLSHRRLILCHGLGCRCGSPLVLRLGCRCRPWVLGRPLCHLILLGCTIFGLWFNKNMWWVRRWLLWLLSTLGQLLDLLLETRGKLAQILWRGTWILLWNLLLVLCLHLLKSNRSGIVLRHELVSPLNLTLHVQNLVFSASI